MKTLREYELLLEEFNQHYPNYARNIVEWFPVGRKEITIRLRDGKLLVYSLYGNTVQVIVENDPYEEQCDDEAKWRESFAKRLDRLMRIRGFTSDRLSRESGLSTVTLSKYLNGISTPSTYNARKIARAMDVSVMELI